MTNSDPKHKKTGDNSKSDKISKRQLKGSAQLSIK
uniref:Uncharacterized protein n=1 Tax=Arundo donax TaxID=35708 RepID=A0A0A9H3H0_ARUDO